jgi:hypothetical protein
MLCALTVRRLKPGAFEDFKQEWDAVGQPEGWTRSYTVRKVDDQDEIVSFGFFDGSLEELRRSQKDSDYAGWRGRVDPLVESTGTDGIFEVVMEQGT